MSSTKASIAALAAALLILGIAAIPSRSRAQEGPQGPQAPAPAQEPRQPMPPSNQPNPKPQQPPPPTASVSVQSNLVNVDAIVTDADDNLVTGLKRTNFRVLDNGQPQEITNFAPTDAPLTTVMLVEFSARYYGYYGFKSAYWADGFLQALKPQDWVALKTFDIRPRLDVDFTQNKRQIDEALAGLGFPGFKEADLFDALYETLNELKDVKGKRSVLVLATGFDTISKHTLDEILSRLKENDITIFCVGMGEEIELYQANSGGVAYLQAKNQLSTFARMSGGYAYFPRFTGEMSGIFNTIAQYLRSQYTLVFSPNTPQDGKYHKLTVQVLDDQGNPLQLTNGKGKMKKAQVVAREGYLAPSPQPAN